MSFARLLLLGAAGYLLYTALRRWQEGAVLLPALPAPSPLQPLPAPSGEPGGGDFSMSQPPMQDPIAGTSYAGSRQAPAQPAAGARAVSAAGQAFIQNWEKFSLQPYPDAGGHSIYWGHFIQPGETFLHTMADAESYWARDLAKVTAALNSLVRVPLTQAQYDALADFIYNLGVQNFWRSTLLRKLNAGDYAGAAAELSKWDLSQGHVVQGLENRRVAEAAMFNGSAVA